MDLAAITALNGIGGTSVLRDTSSLAGTSTGKDSYTIRDLSSVTGILTPRQEMTEGTMFESLLNTAIDNIKTTNSYLSDKEDEQIKFALGETENTHDLMIAMQKASTALQYTVAIRDKVLEAYRELMQMQI